MYDAIGKLVMTKDNTIQDIVLVKDGEMPFTSNPNVIRLNISNLSVVAKNPVTEGSKSYKYKFRLSLKNPTDNVIKDVYRISFLKYNGMPLTRSGHECCMGLDVVKDVKTGGVIRIEDINKADNPLVF